MKQKSFIKNLVFVIVIVILAVLCAVLNVTAAILNI